MSGNTVTAFVKNRPDAKVTEMKMMLSTATNQDKSMLIVEGEDDRKFYMHFVNNDDVIFYSLGGCHDLPVILSLSNTYSILKDRVIGIKDADFDRLTGKTYNLHNLFLTDTHDWETMALIEESEQNISIEAISRIEKGLFKKVMNDLESYSYLKFYNQVEICDKSLDGISFRDFNLKKLYDGNNKCQVDACLREVKNHHNNARLQHFPETEDIARFKNSHSQLDLLQLTCGHDLIHGVVERMNYLLGKNTTVGYEKMYYILRSSFTKEMFKQTTLYHDIKAWSEEHGRVIWAA